MDTRRFLIPVAASVLLAGCATSQATALPIETLWLDPEPAPLTDMPMLSLVVHPAQAGLTAGRRGSAPTVAAQVPTAPPVPRNGRQATAAANLAARAMSRDDAFVGGVRVFAWAPGRVYEVWTAPLRVTTLTLSPGEVLQSKAAGDTVRWQIGEATSGAGGEVRTHVMLKPLQAGLATNLVLTTNRRVYLIELKSGGVEGFNSAVTWAVEDPVVESVVAPVEPPPPLIAPDAVLDGRYRIEPQGRRPRWTPTSAFNDGRRTFITFAPDMQVDEAPALFVIAADGERQMVNYRQVGGLFIVDRLFNRGELRLGSGRPQVVRIVRVQGGRS